jgi:hypothetical protein
VIRVQDRDLASLPEEDNRRVRALQRRYIELWTQVARRIDEGVPASVWAVRLPAVFGLLNATPHLPAGRPDDVRATLSAMARDALLGAAVAAPAR